MSPRQHRPSPAEQLPEAELEVLSYLHEAGEADASDVRQALAHFRPLSHPSVVTLLRRLESRGLVTRRKADRGKAFVYTPVTDAGVTRSSVMSRVLERVFRRDSLGMVSTLFDVRPPTTKELAELRRLVDELQASKGGKK